MTERLAWDCFRYFAHLDRSNAAIHLAEVRYSPITFRLAGELEHSFTASHAGSDRELVQHVLKDRGAYPEDPGR